MARMRATERCNIAAKSGFIPLLRKVRALEQLRNPHLSVSNGAVIHIALTAYALHHYPKVFRSNNQVVDVRILQGAKPAVLRRYAAMAREREAGRTFEAIGKLHKLTRQRVQQIVKIYNLSQRNGNGKQK